MSKTDTRYLGFFVGFECYEKSLFNRLTNTEVVPVTVESRRFSDG
jgi:hypothetical protein